MPKTLLLLTMLTATPIIAAPPAAPLRPVTDDYHGEKITDNYRYMENLADPEVQTWIKAQANYASDYLKKLPGRDALLARIQELDAGTPYRLYVVRRWPNGDLHYLKAAANENLDKLYFKNSKTNQETLLVDPEKLSDPAKGAHVALEFVRPSPDVRYIAYGLAAAGSEQTTLHILDTTTGKDLPETIDRMEADYTPPYWLPEGNAFVYSRRQQLPSGAPPTDGYKKTHALLHRLGTDPKNDPILFSIDTKSTPMSETDFPSLVLSADSKFVIGKIKHGDANELTLYAATLESLLSSIPRWKKVCDVEDEVSDFAIHQGQVYLLSAKDAPRYKVLQTSLENPDFAKAQIILPPSQAVLKSVSVAKDALYVGTLDAGQAKIIRIPFTANAKPQPIPLPPGATSAYANAVHPDVEGLFIATESWTRRGKLYNFDPAKESFTDTGLRPAGKFDDLPGFESTEVQVKSHDGVMVPVSILHQSNIKLDGSHPTLLVGYGAYGHVMSAHFSPVNLAWLEKGGVLAYAHIRGGGEFGKEWHHAGQKQTKPNTWKDFLACAHYLIDQKYTAPNKLAGQGGSAGGILIGRAITTEPQTFAAAIIQVGCTDMLRMETTTNGVPNIPEFGTVKTKEGYDALKEMSTLHQVKDNTNYPAVLLVHGINDPRVEPWMSAKLTARLQAASTSQKPILFRVDYEAGHGIGSTKKQRQEQQADQWSFILNQTNP